MRLFSWVLTGLTTLTLAALITPGSASGWLGVTIWTFLIVVPFGGIPVACTVAVLKYRLYEIDRLISRTASYAIVTGLLIGVYAGAGDARHPGAAATRCGPA